MKTENSFSNFTITPNDDDLILKILSKFDSLLEKDEYYNHQERLYRLNKAMTAIANAQNVEVSKFNESELERRPSSDAVSQGSEKIVVDLHKINEVLDNFIKAKDDQVNIIPQLDLITSSSEDERESKSNHSSETIKKRILHNLYNYEIFLKGLFFERSLKDDLSIKPQMIYKDFSQNQNQNPSLNACSNFSTGKNGDTVSLNLNDKTPSTTKQFSKNDASLFNGSTPILKKSFFEDQNVKNEISRNNRRKSHNEELKRQLGMATLNTLVGQPRRRSEMIGMKFQQEEYHKELICKSNNDGIISEFNVFLSNNGNNNHTENNISTVSANHNNSLFEKRSSIFKETNNLTHIIEADEFFSNFSRGMNVEEDKEEDVEVSLKSEEDELDENI